MSAPGLGHNYISETREGSEDTPSCRVGKHRDIGNTFAMKTLNCRGCLRHLQERIESFLHSGAAAGDNADERISCLQRELRGKSDFLANHDPHAATHESEIQDREDDSPPAQRRGSGNRRIEFAGSFSLFIEPVGVRLVVFKFERIV